MENQATGIATGTPPTCGCNAGRYSYRPNGKPVRTPNRSTACVVIAVEMAADAVRRPPQWEKVEPAVLQPNPPTVSVVSARRRLPPAGANGVNSIADAVDAAATTRHLFTASSPRGQNLAGPSKQKFGATYRRDVGTACEHVVVVALYVVEERCICTRRESHTRRRAPPQ